jgi:hypothetical protein
MKNYIETAINNLAVAQDKTLRWSHEWFINEKKDFDNIIIYNGKSFNFNWNDVQAKANELEQAQEQAKQAKIDAKASALAKLSALGLTEEEVQAIIK